MLKSLLAMTDGQELPGRFDGDYDCWVLPEVDARPLELAQLDRELGAMADAEGEDGRWQSPTCILDTDRPDRAYEVEPMDELVLHSEGAGTLHALAGIGLPRYFDEAFEADAMSLLEPMMDRLDARAQAPAMATNAFFGPETFVVKVEFQTMADKTVGELLDIALAAQALLKAARSGSINKDVVRDLVRGGYVRALVGQRESVWLEAKNQPWGLDTAQGKAEAAKDLSALANAEGGLVVIPAQTSSQGGDDVIIEIGTLPLELIPEVQLRDTISRWTFPPLRGITIDLIDCEDGRGQVLVAVPAHRPEDWPHFVVGDPEAAFPSAAIAAYVRDGAKNRALSAAELHRLTRRSLA